MSASFLFLGPFVAGLITVHQSPASKPWPIKAWIFVPWLPVFLNIVLALSAAWEGIICVIFILPPAFLSASLGGVAAGLYHRYFHRRLNRTTLVSLAALPILCAMVETRLTQPLQTRTVDTSVVIHAPLPVVWQNIERVRAIAPSELRHSWANTIGFPRPVEATLSHEGIGGVRNASFERGLNFTETIIDWVPNQRIVFTIQADTAAIPRSTLDEHVTVGGRFFDVLTGEYDLHSLPNGDNSTSAAASVSPPTSTTSTLRRPLVRCRHARHAVQHPPRPQPLRAHRVTSPPTVISTEASRLHAMRAARPCIYFARSPPNSCQAPHPSSNPLNPLITMTSNAGIFGPLAPSKRVK